MTDVMTAGGQDKTRRRCGSRESDSVLGRELEHFGKTI
jgi:hypothetical protein